MRQWTSEELQYLKENFRIKTYREIAQVLNRTYTSVSKKVEHDPTFIKLEQQQVSTELLQYIKQHYYDESAQQIAEKFQCSTTTIVSYARKLNLSFKPNATTDYKEQIEALNNEVGIYQITNLNNNKKYIGYTCNIKRRFKEHLQNLFKNKGENKLLQEDYNKGDKFKVEVLYQNDDTMILANKEVEFIESVPLEQRYNVTIENKQHYNMSAKAIQIFWKYVVKQESGCWLWIRPLDKYGYGAFGYWDKITQKSIKVKAHKFSYILTKGQVPNGLKILHICDNKACVNPDHLYLGSDKINGADRKRSKLCGRKIKYDYKKIIELHKQGLKNIEIAKAIGGDIHVVQSSVCYILKKWRTGKLANV